ncbi:SH3 domain-containing protein [Lentzea tibetensis]|uniref:SH3 domain-containing protein n=1 Tax=Lentzea tibetensis TaxID=2591470 RepID=A0A563EWV1_9PSEU|nr:SH3 domain-containing protein [Lentzea tibetensis]TWP52186.1 SH3 domain-containing protein [Lentzea tibetensis]
MQFTKAAAGSALAAAALVGSATTAVAAPAELYHVTAWHDVNIRSCEARSCPVVGHIEAGERHIAYCWTDGETISDFGITNNIWLMVSRQDGGRWLASAVYFQGDRYANLPADAHCDY